MPEDEPIDRHAPTLTPETERERITQPPESTTDPSRVLAEVATSDSDLAVAARAFSAALVELRETRADINKGFQDQGADLRVIRHDLQGFGTRLTNVESSTRDLRGEVADLKLSVRSALQRIEALEAELNRRKTSVPAPSAAPGA